VHPDANRGASTPSAWAHGDVYAIDTKGSHIKADAMQKIVRIRQAPGRPRLLVRFVVQGRLDGSGADVEDVGYTVIGLGRADK